jgi:hypothetical protein
MLNRATSLTADRPETGELAESRWRRGGHSALQRLCCDLHASVLTVRGRLPSYYLKQFALAVVTTVEGVQRVEGQIMIEAPAAFSASDEPGPARRSHSMGPKASPLLES